MKKFALIALIAFNAVLLASGETEAELPPLSTLLDCCVIIPDGEYCCPNCCQFTDNCLLCREAAPEA